MAITKNILRGATRGVAKRNAWNLSGATKNIKATSSTPDAVIAARKKRQEFSNYNSRMGAKLQKEIAEAKSQRMQSSVPSFGAGLKNTNLQRGKTSARYNTRQSNRASSSSPKTFRPQKFREDEAAIRREKNALNRIRINHSVLEEKGRNHFATNFNINHRAAEAKFTGNTEILENVKSAKKEGYDFHKATGKSQYYKRIDEIGKENEKRFAKRYASAQPKVVEAAESAGIPESPAMSSTAPAEVAQAAPNAKVDEEIKALRRIESNHPYDYKKDPKFLISAEWHRDTNINYRGSRAESFDRTENLDYASNSTRDNYDFHKADGKSHYIGDITPFSRDLKRERIERERTEFQKNAFLDGSGYNVNHGEGTVSGLADASTLGQENSLFLPGKTSYPEQIENKVAIEKEKTALNRIGYRGTDAQASLHVEINSRAAAVDAHGITEHITFASNSAKKNYRINKADGKSHYFGDITPSARAYKQELLEQEKAALPTNAPAEVTQTAPAGDAQSKAIEAAEGAGIKQDAEGVITEETKTPDTKTGTGETNETTGNSTTTVEETKSEAALERERRKKAWEEHNKKEGEKVRERVKAAQEEKQAALERERQKKAWEEHNRREGEKVREKVKEAQEERQAAGEKVLNDGITLQGKENMSATNKFALKRLNNEANDTLKLFSTASSEEKAELAKQMGLQSENPTAHEFARAVNSHYQDRFNAGPGALDYIGAHKVVSGVVGAGVVGGGVLAMSSNRGQQSNAQLYGSPY